MHGGDLTGEARRRAGLTQQELAQRLGTTQSAVARMERRRTEPSFERVAAAARACGLELVPRLLTLDHADWSVASTNLAVTPDERVRRHRAALAFAQAGRKALADVGA